MILSKLNRRQFDKLSDIGSDLALVSIASIILPAAFDKFDSTKILLGSMATVFFWWFSIWIRR